MRLNKIELLAPAKNLECGMEAVNHGADAVYIGAPRFGARAAASNSVEDIAALTEYAHLYNVRVYVTLNTILNEEELRETEQLIGQLYRAGVDALIVQDMGITQLHLPPIPLHASTQTDNRTVEKVRFLADAGFRQVVLARELSLSEIRAIREACPDVTLEVFVHGALCVSYSGQCYASQACFGRSANRGECAQFCRLPFSLLDVDGKVIVRDKHLLSLRDLNRSDLLEELLDAGVTSLKIEGRLKDVNYVKNVTAAYRRKLDDIFARRKEYVRASSGSCRYTFRPQLEKSFNRGFTHYFLHGREREITSFDTPKSMGERMGTVTEQRGNTLTVSTAKSFHNGDGICYVDSQGHLQGFRVNKIVSQTEAGSQKLEVRSQKAEVRIGKSEVAVLYRNYDAEFERILSRKSAERRIGLSWTLAETAFGFSLTATDEDGNRATLAFPYPKEPARMPQADHLRKILSELGNTPFQVADDWSSGSVQADWFLPASVVADWRRRVIERLTVVRRINHRREVSVWRPTAHPYPATSLTYLGNVMNSAARDFYRAHGVESVAPAFESSLSGEGTGTAVMFCKHCLRFSMGWCGKHQKGKSPYREPYFLLSADGRRFRLDFDCRQCIMRVSLP